MFRILCFAFTWTLALCFMFDGPCFLTPYTSWNETANFTVPEKCENGTLDWNYPRGHLLMTFLNKQKISTVVCIRDSVGGQVFNITDTRTNISLTGFDRDTWACTEPSNQPAIVLKFDAPWMQRYMGAVDYSIEHGEPI